VAAHRQSGVPAAPPRAFGWRASSGLRRPSIPATAPTAAAARTIEDPSRITAQSLTYYDVGARLGVLGTPIPVAGNAGLLEALRTMTVRTTDGTGQELAAGAGSAILGQPLDAVIFIAATLKRNGGSLNPGDLLSLGAFSPGPIRPGTAVKVTYQGLPGNPSVEAKFP